MKVSFLLANLEGMGGAEKISIQLAGALQERGVEVTIYTLRGGSAPCFALNRGVKVVNCHYDESHSWIDSLKKAWQLRSKITAKGRSTLIVTGTPLIAHAFLATWLRGIRVIVWDHSAFDYNFPRWRAACCALASRLVVLTGTDRDTYRKRYPLRRARIETIHNFFDRETAARGPHIDLGAKRVISVGRLSPEKGVDRLLDVWERVEPLAPEWSLDIVGDGGEMEVLKQRARKMHRVNFLGRRGDVAELLAQCSIFAMASRTEGFSLVLLEAQSAGLPCIAYDCPSGPREVLTTDNGILVEDGNTEEYARRLLALMNDLGELRRLSSNTAENLLRFDREKITDRWLEIIAR